MFIAANFGAIPYKSGIMTKLVVSLVHIYDPQKALTGWPICLSCMTNDVALSSGTVTTQTALLIGGVRLSVFVTDNFQKSYF